QRSVILQLHFAQQDVQQVVRVIAFLRCESVVCHDESSLDSGVLRKGPTVLANSHAALRGEPCSTSRLGDEFAKILTTMPFQHSHYSCVARKNPMEIVTPAPFRL